MLVALDYVGVIGVEFFVLRDALSPHPEEARSAVSKDEAKGLLRMRKTPRVIVNEFAPRVHNSGHWTSDACAVSQFEQHIRAVAGWPLGDPGRHSDCAMDNLIGDEVERWRDLAREAGACIHLYGKRDALPGRKMGHVTRIRPKA